LNITDGFSDLILKSWKGELGFTDIISEAEQLINQGLQPLAVVLYQTWLQKNQNPYAHAIYFNLGALLASLDQLPEAESANRKAIEIAPSFMHPRVNLGLVLERKGHMDEAIKEWDWVADHCPNDENNQPLLLGALNHLGRVHERLKQFERAINYLSRSLAHSPDQPDAIHHWVFLRQKICAWPVYTPLPGLSQQQMKEHTSALAMLSVSDDPEQQLNAARQFILKKVTQNLPALSKKSTYGHKKIRIAYASGDFCSHPVSLLTVGLFELHDREQFEVYGYDWSPEDNSDLRKRVMKAMDHFFPIHGLSAEQSAQLIRSHEIDILIDLQGQTGDARPDMLEYKPAPIQITYLGLPATTGFDSIDYVIADDFIIPPKYAKYYSEKIIYMPDIYMVSDNKRPVGATPTRELYKLPEDKFIFCSLNNSYKYTPEVFDTWIKILKRAPNSVLWLLADNQWAEENLRKEARARGLAPERLIFAERVAPENYLARYALADLFLDTFPFNAGTTANDCLYMGCPILTLTGRSFASRMAGAHLRAVGLNELITHNLKEYEDLAVNLAIDPERCRRMREHLLKEKEHGAAFNTLKFVRELEARLVPIYNSLPPPKS
jgi:predicted O-linked N-acetylglucosamine transferase (SPINDLY family)